MRRVARQLTLGTLALLAISTTGCWGVHNGYNIGFLGYPIPVSPYFQHKQEEKFWMKERYDRVPILGPTTSGGPPVALDPPTDDEIIHTIPVDVPAADTPPGITDRCDCVGVYDFAIDDESLAAIARCQ